MREKRRTDERSQQQKMILTDYGVRGDRDRSHHQLKFGHQLFFFNIRCVQKRKLNRKPLSIENKIEHLK